MRLKGNSDVPAENPFHRELAKASIGVQVPVNKAPDTDRPPLKNAAGAGLVPRSHLLVSIVGVLCASVVVAGI